MSVDLRQRKYALDIDPAAMDGQDVVVAGWIQETRDMGGIAFVILRDRLGNPLATPVTVASCNSAVAAVIPASDAPQVRTAFFVKGVAFNATSVCVTASASGFKDTMHVSTVPFSLAITGGPDSITSGTTGVFTFVYKDAKGVYDAALQVHPDDVHLRWRLEKLSWVK